MYIILEGGNWCKKNKAADLLFPFMGSPEFLSKVSFWSWRGLCVCLFCFVLKKFFFQRLFIFGTERDRAWTGEGPRERETQNLKQASGSELSAQSPTPGSNLWTMRSPEPKSDTQLSELPRHPLLLYFLVGILFWGRAFLSPPFAYLLSVWIRGFLFHSVGYNPLLSLHILMLYPRFG